MGKPWVIRLTEIPDGGYDIRIVAPFYGYYLAAYDPDAKEGLGEATFTADVEAALRFPTFDEARDCWYQQSTVLPTRASARGEYENRPLAFCSVDISQVP